MNSIIEAQEEYFEGRILFIATDMPDSMLFHRRYEKAEEVALDRKQYLDRCALYVADQQARLWDYKMRVV